MKNIGKCMNVGGDVYVRSLKLGDGPLVRGAYLQLGDEIITEAGAFAHIEFLDRARFALSENTRFTIDAFNLGSNDEEGCAEFTLVTGTCVCISGRLASGVDDFIIQAGETTLSLRQARVAVILRDEGDDLVTLLPQVSEPPGEVLAHTQTGVAVLNRTYQTLRFGGSGHDLSAPMTLPSRVVISTYMGPGLERAFVEAAIDEEDLLEKFEPFNQLNDQLLERQFISSHVYPAEMNAKDGHDNALLEDTFSGKRFRLSEGSD